MGGGGKAPPPPQPSAEERQLQSEQAQLVRLQRDQLLQQQEQFKLLEPVLLKQSGLERVFIPGTGLAPERRAALEAERQRLSAGVVSLGGSLADAGRNFVFEQGPDGVFRARPRGGGANQQRIREIDAELAAGTPGRFELRETKEATSRRELENLILERSAKALKGELPIDQGLLSDLASREELTREGLRRQLGPGFESSTPGIQALKEFETFRGATLDAARRGDIADILPQRTNLRPPETFAGIRGSAADAFGSVASQFGQLQAPLRRQRELEFQSALSQPRSRTGAGIGALLGTVGGAVAAPFTAGTSLAFTAATGAQVGGLFGAGFGGLFDG